MPYNKIINATDTMNTFSLDKNDLKLIFDSLCYFDMDHQCTGYYTDALNDSFNYLYDISKKVGLEDG